MWQPPGGEVLPLTRLPADPRSTPHRPQAAPIRAAYPRRGGSPGWARATGAQGALGSPHPGAGVPPPRAAAPRPPSPAPRVSPGASSVSPRPLQSPEAPTHRAAAGGAGCGRGSVRAGPRLRAGSQPSTGSARLGFGRRLRLGRGAKGTAGTAPPRPPGATCGAGAGAARAGGGPGRGAQEAPPVGVGLAGLF